MKQLFSNNADTTLENALDDSWTTIEVADSSNFATITGTDFQMATITSGGLFETIKIADMGAGWMDIVRAQEGTTARAWPAGSRVFAGVTRGTLDALRAADGFEYVETLSPGATALGANAINIQTTRLEATRVASGSGAIVIGEGTGAGPDSIAIGYRAIAQLDDAIAIGGFSSALDYSTLALGNGIARYEYAFNMARLPAAVRVADHWGNSGAFASGGTMETVILSDAVDLKTAATITCAVPASITFYADEVGIIVETATGVTVQPEISFGITGDNDKLLAAVTTTGLDAAKKRQRFATLLSAHGETSYTFTVTTAATATALTARVYWKGFAVQDAAA